MPEVRIIELSGPHDITGEHVWVGVVFTSGVTVTLRVDEHAMHNNERPRLYTAVNEEVGVDHNL